jgi:hypothetical protein
MNEQKSAPPAKEGSAEKKIPAEPMTPHPHQEGVTPSQPRRAARRRRSPRRDASQPWRPSEVGSLCSICRSTPASLNS